MYNKLFTTILDSSVWLQSQHIRIVWITFIAAMDEVGIVHISSVGNVALRANVSRDEAVEAIKYLEAPDPESRNEANEGRRVERFPGGWVVVNHQYYRNLVTKEVAKEQTKRRVARHRAKKSGDECNGLVTDGNENVTPSEAVSESDIKILSSKSDLKIKEAVVVLDFMNSKRKKSRPYKAFKLKKGKGGVDVSSTSLGFILARLRSGGSKDECMAIINLKAKEWLGDLKMEMYFRPSTLFNETNFDKYVAELPVDGDDMDNSWHPQQSKNY